MKMDYPYPPSDRFETGPRMPASSPVIMIGLIVGVVLLMGGILVAAGFFDRQVVQQKYHWMREHHCVTAGYVPGNAFGGQVQPMYRCDDGLHIWADIPRA